MSTSDHTGPPTTAGTAENQRREEARQYVQQLRAFYTHAIVFAGSMVIIFLVNLAVNVAAGLTGEWWAWWSGWALIGWAVGLAIHGLVVRMARPKRSTSEWEQKQIDKILAKNNADPLQ